MPKNKQVTNDIWGVKEQGQTFHTTLWERERERGHHFPLYLTSSSVNRQMTSKSHLLFRELGEISSANYQRPENRKVLKCAIKQARLTQLENLGRERERLSEIKAKSCLH